MWLCLLGRNLILNEIKRKGSVLGENFVDWKLINNDERIIKVGREIESTQWENIWSYQGWKNVQSRNILGNLIITNGTSEIGRLHELVKKMETIMLGKLNELLNEP